MAFTTRQVYNTTVDDEQFQEIGLALWLMAMVDQHKGRSTTYYIACDLVWLGNFPTSFSSLRNFGIVINVNLLIFF